MYKLENTLDRMKTLIEIREILRGIYIFPMRRITSMKRNIIWS